MSYNDNFKYEVDPDFDFVIDELSNRFMALRKIKWGNSDEYKLDLRRYYSTEDGEKMEKGKGISFLTDDGPNELTRVLVEQGYGLPEDIAEAIMNRSDSVKILESIDSIVDDCNEGIDPKEVV